MKSKIWTILLIIVGGVLLWGIGVYFINKIPISPTTDTKDFKKLLDTYTAKNLAEIKALSDDFQKLQVSVNSMQSERLVLVEAFNKIGAYKPTVNPTEVKTLEDCTENARKLEFNLNLCKDGQLNLTSQLKNCDQVVEKKDLQIQDALKIGEDWKNQWIMQTDYSGRLEKDIKKIKGFWPTVWRWVKAGFIGFGVGYAVGKIIK